MSLCSVLKAEVKHWTQRLLVFTVVAAVSFIYLFETESCPLNQDGLRLMWPTPVLNSQ